MSVSAGASDSTRSTPGIHIDQRGPRAEAVGAIELDRVQRHVHVVLRQPFRREARPGDASACRRRRPCSSRSGKAANSARHDRIAMRLLDRSIPWSTGLLQAASDRLAGRRMRSPTSGRTRVLNGVIGRLFHRFAPSGQERISNHRNRQRPRRGIAQDAWADALRRRVDRAHALGSARQYAPARQTALQATAHPASVAGWIDARFFSPRHFSA